MTPAERQAAQDMAREDLYFFARWMFKQRRGTKWVRGPHHRVICDALMRVFRGECRRLIINVPPRYSKTELAVVNFAAWALGRVPDAEFIHVSYAASLAVANSGNIQALMQHEAYRDIFPETRVANDAKAAWKTTADGVMYAAGSGGTLTGFGAGKLREGFGGAIIIDDLHKADEATSEVIRKGVIDWFKNTLESRLNSPQTPIVIIMQRLHEEDLAGWLLAGGNGEQWEHVCLPALRDDGTALWPEKHTVEELRRMQRTKPYEFAGQYQQRPAPIEGGIFKPGSIQIIDAVPEGSIRWVRGWDLGSTRDGDPSVGLRMGKMPDGRYVISDVQRDWLGPDERDQRIRNIAALDGKTTIVDLPQDPGQAGKTQVLYLTRSLAGYTVKSSPETGDKVTRAEPFAAQVNVGNVLMVRAPWNQALVDEMKMFPNGLHDDQIDACSRAFAQLIAPPEPARVVQIAHMGR